MDRPRTKRDLVAFLPAERIERRILLVRGQKVMLDSDLAMLYGVPTFRLNEQVRRNQMRFPSDFMFQLTQSETKALISQIAISKSGRGGRRKPALVFTEHGVAMLASVLRSERAVLVGIEIVRAFIRLRHIMRTHQDLARRLEEVERRHDSQFKIVFDLFRKIMVPRRRGRRHPMGFRGG